MRAENSVEQDRAQALVAMLDHLPVIVFTSDAEGRITYVEGGTTTTLGKDPSENLGKRIDEVSAHIPDALALLRGVLTGETQNFVTRYGDRALQTWLSPTRTGDGAITGMVGITLDVSEQARAAADAEFLRLVVNTAPQFIAVGDLDGKLRSVNPGGRRLVGIPDDFDVTTTTIPDYCTPDGLRHTVEVEQPAVMRDGFYQGETTLKHWPTGRGIPVLATSFLIRDPMTGEPMAMATLRTDMSAQAEVTRETERRMSEQRSLLLHLHEAHEHERRRIAGEMHDDAIQAVAAVNLQVQTTIKELESLAPHPAVERLQSAADTAQAAGRRLRRLLHRLDEPAGLEEDLLGVLRQYLQDVCDQSCTWRVNGHLSSSPPRHAARALFRIAQEALANARAHASATHIEVGVAEVDEGYVLTVRDDGPGLPPAFTVLPRQRPSNEPGHLGLRNMAERAESVGGWFAASSAAGGGTVVEAWVPTLLGYDPSAPQAAASAQTFLRQAMESIAEGFAAIDRSWRFVYVNQVGSELLRGEALTGRLCWDVLDLAPEVEDAYREAVRSGMPTRVRAKHKDIARWIEHRAFPSSAGLSVFFRDVTDEQQAEEAVAEHLRVISSGQVLVHMLAEEADLQRALRMAVEPIRQTLDLDGVRLVLTDPPGLDVVSGDLDGPGPHRTVPLAVRGQEVGKLQVSGVNADREELLGLADLVALRIGAG